MTDKILQLLTSSSKLDRDKGIVEYESLIKSQDCPERDKNVEEVENTLHNLVSSDNCKWEEKHGYLLALKSLVGFKKKKGDHTFLSKVQNVGIHYLQDGEVRVRSSAGELLGELCKHHGVQIYRISSDKVIQLIKSNLERQLDPDNEGSMRENEEVEKLMEKLASNKPADSSQIFHDTAGWKNLETSMKCLQHMIEGCGAEFRSEFTEELFSLLTTTLSHTNRFVRETGFYVCTSLISACSSTPNLGEAGDLVERMDVDEVGEEAGLDEETGSPILRFGTALSEHLGRGLADNWSQVRLASSTATRAFLLSLDKEDRKQFFPVLLPRLCLNRYYLAEGVRIYSQKTWSEVMGSEGCKLVEEYLSSVIEYYTSATTANNHAVREAACQCIAELAKKINLEILQPYVSLLLGTLIDCFKDDSWPVRDMACVAAGSFVRCYPTESRGSLPVLLPLFWQNLGDPISSVRQGAAIAIANTIRAYGVEVLPEVVEKVNQGIEDLQNQPVESEKYGNLDTGPANFGVAKRVRDNDPELHENQQMYSCGSLAPKMGRGGGGGGCTESKFRKPSEPWELADGCVHLVGEIANIKDCQNCENFINTILTPISRVVERKHFVNHLSLFHTVCVRFSGIAKVVPKKILKAHLEEFFDLIFYSLESENGLASYAAEECLETLSKVLGPNILSGRIENYNPRFFSSYQRHLSGQPGTPIGSFGSSPGSFGIAPPPRREIPFAEPLALRNEMREMSGTSSSPMAIPSRSGASFQPSLGGTPT